MEMKREREVEFRDFFVDTYGDALRFAERRSAPDRAEDAVADAMLVAWRRFDDAPHDPGERRAWLFGIMRNTMLNKSRSESRQSALAIRIIDTMAVSEISDHAHQVGQRLDLAVAWSRLTSGEQEALSLAIFEQLTAPQAARVLEISSVAFRARLARARRALQAHLSHPLPSNVPHQIQEVSS